jgi:hypothetical protein
VKISQVHYNIRCICILFGNRFISYLEACGQLQIHYSYVSVRMVDVVDILERLCGFNIDVRVVRHMLALKFMYSIVLGKNDSTKASVNPLNYYIVAVIVVNVLLMCLVNGCTFSLS